MADITDGAAINFCNTNIRPFADRLLQAYWIGKQTQSEYNSNTELSSNLAASGPNVDDGSPSDGRLQMTGDKAYATMESVSQLITLLESNNNQWLNVLQAVAVNPLP